MNILKIRNEYRFQKLKESDEFNNDFFKLLSQKLKKKRLLIESHEDYIEYRSKVLISYIPRERQRLHIIRKGKIKINNSFNNYLINSEINFTGHFLLSFFIGLIFCIGFGFNFDYTINYMILSTFIITSLIYFPGYLIIRLQMNRIIKESLIEFEKIKYK